MRTFIAVVGFALLCWSLAQAQPEGWSVQPSPTTNDLFGIASVDSTIWVAVGDAGTILRTTDAGLTWVSVANPAGDALRAVSFHASLGIVVGFAGRVLRTTDGGITWESEARPTSKALYAVSVGDSMAVITGEEGSIFVSGDDGISWTQRFAGTAANLFGVSVNGNYAVGVGGGAAVVMTDNRGSAWGLTVLGPLLTSFYAVSFPTPRTGWAVGTDPSDSSLVIRSDVYGVTWTVQHAPSMSVLFGVSFTDTSNGTAVGANGTIFRTTDGGNTWALQASGVGQSLNAVAFSGPRQGIAVGSGGTILRTTTGGIAGVETPPHGSAVPQQIMLGQNYPNPFNPSTRIEYTIPARGVVSLKVFDLLGREVRSLVNAIEEAGNHSVRFDAAGLPSGVYRYRLQLGGFTETKSLILLR